eukprot:5662836-Lingulodinium_polyedra.AAC.1
MVSGARGGRFCTRTRCCYLRGEKPRLRDIPIMDAAPHAEQFYSTSPAVCASTDCAGDRARS